MLHVDGCRPNNTINSISSDTSLDWILEWPETDIGQIVNIRYNHIMVDSHAHMIRLFLALCYRCPCGPEDYDIGIIRNATRQCAGTFEKGAKWDDPVDDSCTEFSATARQICNLYNVCVCMCVCVCGGVGVRAGMCVGVC